MLERFRISGINPATGEVVKLLVHAETAMDAKAQAESCGLMHVVVKDEAPIGAVRAALPYWVQEPATVQRW